MRLLMVSLVLVLGTACSTGGSPRPPTDAATAAVQRLEGRYSVMADTGWFVDCASGQRLWVVQEGANAELETASLIAGGQRRVPVLATVEGRVVRRVNMEGPERPALLVERVIAVSASAACPASTSASTTLQDIHWTLVELRGAAVQGPAGRAEPHLLFQSSGRRLSGHSGCNRLTGTYELDGERLRLGRVAATRMACVSGAEVERVFLDMLGAVDAWRVDGQELQLIDAGGAVVARFTARPR